MLKMKITINLLPRHKLYALDVYSGVEVILEVHEWQWQAPLKKNLTILILYPLIHRTMEVNSKRKCLFCWWSNPGLLDQRPVMLLTELYRLIRADVRKLQLNREEWAENLALTQSKLMYTKFEVAYSNSLLFLYFLFISPSTIHSSFS
jgi:hypothetical protein